MVIYCVEDRTIQSLEVFKMRCLLAISGVTRADRLQNSKIREYTFTPESIIDVIRHRTRRQWFGHVCCMQRDNIIRQANKQNFKGQQKIGRLLKRCDQIRNDTWLPLLTAERHAINRRGGATCA